MTLLEGTSQRIHIPSREDAREILLRNGPKFAELIELYLQHAQGAEPRELDAARESLQRFRLSQIKLASLCAFQPKAREAQDPPATAGAEPSRKLEAAEEELGSAVRQLALAGGYADWAMPDDLADLLLVMARAINGRW